MNNKLSTLGLSADRVLIQLILPGLIAITPIIFHFFKYYPIEREYLLSNPTFMTTLFTFFALLVGLFLENIGSWIELYYYDKCNEKKDKDFQTVWNNYLLINFDGKEPIGQGYMKSILNKMKTELSIGLALIPVSLYLIFYLSKSLSNIGLCILGIIILFISLFLILISGLKSSRVLANIRKSIVEKYCNDVFNE